MFEDDYLLRTIRQIVLMLQRLLGLVEAGDQEEARDAVEQLYARLLGPNRDLLDHYDGATLYHLLPDHEHAVALASTCALDARLHQRSGEHALAAARIQQARALVTLARAEPLHRALARDVEALERRLGELEQGTPGTNR